MGGCARSLVTREAASNPEGAMPLVNALPSRHARDLMGQCAKPPPGFGGCLPLFGKGRGCAAGRERGLTCVCLSVNCVWESVQLSVACTAWSCARYKVHTWFACPPPKRVITCHPKREAETNRIPPQMEEMMHLAAGTPVGMPLRCCLVACEWCIF